MAGSAFLLTGFGLSKCVSPSSRRPPLPQTAAPGDAARRGDDASALTVCVGVAVRGTGDVETPRLRSPCLPRLPPCGGVSLRFFFAFSCSARSCSCCFLMRSCSASSIISFCLFSWVSFKRSANDIFGGASLRTVVAERGGETDERGTEIVGVVDGTGVTGEVAGEVVVIVVAVVIVVVVVVVVFSFLEGELGSCLCCLL